MDLLWNELARYFIIDILSISIFSHTTYRTY